MLCQRTGRNDLTRLHEYWCVIIDDLTLNFMQQQQQPVRVAALFQCILFVAVSLYVT